MDQATAAILNRIGISLDLVAGLLAGPLVLEILEPSLSAVERSMKAKIIRCSEAFPSVFGRVGTGTGDFYRQVFASWPWKVLLVASVVMWATLLCRHAYPGEIPLFPGRLVVFVASLLVVLIVDLVLALVARLFWHLANRGWRYARYIAFFLFFSVVTVALASTILIFTLFGILWVVFEGLLFVRRLLRGENRLTLILSRAAIPIFIAGEVLQLLATFGK